MSTSAGTPSATSSRPAIPTRTRSGRRWSEPSATQARPPISAKRPGRSLPTCRMRSAGSATTGTSSCLLWASSLRHHSRWPSRLARMHSATRSSRVTTTRLVFYGVEKLPPEVLADILNGRKKAADIPEAAPLPALTLAVEFEDETRTQWKIAARRATGVSIVRSAAAPSRDDPAFEEALDSFWRLSRMPVEKPEDAALLNTAAHRIGEGLAHALSAEEKAFLITAARGD